LQNFAAAFWRNTKGNKMTRLGQMITAYEQKHDVQSKQVAKEIGIGQSTLTRIKQGAATDAGNLVKIITWMMKEREE
jgi:DNA-binding Xre family transcriptional regulator